MSVSSDLESTITRPFEYLRLNGKLLLYAKKDCTDQLRGRRGVSLDIVKRVVENGICEVTARATLDGRTDTDVGAVFVDGLRGEALANAVMKAHTKAKRRVTLSICGLSIPDESEVETIRGAQAIEERDVLRSSPHAPHPCSRRPCTTEASPLALWSRFSAEITQAPDLCLP